MTALACLAQQERRAPCHHIFTEINKVGQELTKGQLFWSATIQRKHVTAEIGLHRSKAVKLVHHDFGCRIALQLDHYPHAITVRFVLYVRNPVDLLLAHLFRDFFDHGGFIHLIANLVDDDRKAVLANFLDPGLGTHDYTAAPLKIGFARAGSAQHDAAGREVRAGNIFDQLFRRQVGVFDQGLAGIDYFAQIMRRDIRRHTHGNTTCTVDQHVRETCRQNSGFAFLAIVVVDEVDGFLVQIAGHERRDLVQARFRIAHGRSAIAVH